MEEQKLNILKSWEKIAQLINSFSFENDKLHQIEKDILLAAIRNFYQDISLTNSVSVNSNDETENIENSIVNTIAFCNEEKPEEGLIIEDYIVNALATENETNATTIAAETLVTREFPEEVDTQEPLVLENVLDNEITKPNESDSAESVATKRKVEDTQPSLFEYLQASNIEQATQNISKYIETGISEQTSFQKEFSQENITKKSESQTIRDLRDLIGINEKFLFINDLFSGNMKEYTDFILNLNSLNFNEEAELFLHEIRRNRKWAETSHAYTTLLQIVNKRFVI